jgi:hypothetical protein
MAIDNAILGFPHSDRVSKRTLAELWDRQEAIAGVRGSFGPKHAAEWGQRLAQYRMGAADYVQLHHALKYLQGVSLDRA